MREVIPVETMCRLSLGQQGEHLTRAITFDFTSWKNRYGEGSIQLQVQRPGEESPYPVAMHVDGALATWQIERRDTAKAGDGKLQLLYVVNGEQIAKSRVFSTSIKAGLSQPGPVPSEEQTFLDEMMKTAGKAEVAAQNAEKAAQQIAQDCTAVEQASAQAIQAARESAENKMATEVFAQTTAQTVAGFDQHATEKTKQFTDLFNQAQDSITHDKDTVHAEATQTKQNAELVRKAADAVAQQAAETQKNAELAQQAAQQSKEIIDDNALKSTKTWSSRNIVEQLSVPFQKGPKTIVACHPFAGYPLQVVSQIEPVQEGSGDPSPDNVRPIKGFPGVKLVRCGKNILKSAVAQQSVNGIDVLPNDDGSFRISGTASARTEITIASNFLLRKGTYTSGFSKEIILQTNKGYISTMSGGKVVVEDDRIVYHLRMRVDAGSKVNETVYPQLELDAGVTSYEPYQGDQYAVQFGQTVYGGSYDWNSGNLAVNWVSETLDGSTDEGWSMHSDGSIYRYVPKAPADKNGLCNQFPWVLDKSAPKESFSFDGNALEIGENLSSKYKTVRAWTDFLKQNNIVIAYKTAEQTTIKLMPQQVYALPGANTLYSDTGLTVVQGYSDLKYEIQQLKDAIAALGAV